MGPPPLPRTGTSRASERQPVHAPHPPRMSREEEAELTRAEAEAQQREYEADLELAGVPQPKPPVRKAPERLIQREKQQHPLLRQLRAEFGVGTADHAPVEVQAAEHRWTFIQLTPEMIAMAARMADVLSQTSSEHSIRLQQMSVCASIVAIDGTPVWKVMGIEPQKDDNIDDPMVPRGGIRMRAALALYGEIVDRMRNRLIDVLFEAYVAKVDRQGEVRGYGSYEKTSHVVWLCAEEGCQTKRLLPRRFNADNEELAYYCEVHGTALYDVATAPPRIDEQIDPLG